MDNVPALEVIGLTKSFGSFTAISNINLTVKKGEFMGLLGPNGAGKSTTLKSITGLLRPTEGIIRIAGIDIKDHRRAMEHVGTVIETPEPYPNFTPAETMDYIGRMYGMDSREIAIRARDALETVRMWEWRNSKIGEFSKGMRQRVILAQALIHNPDTIILDEPTSGLDPRGMIEIRRTLAELKNHDRSLLISTHILKEVSEICGSVTMIRNGRTVASGPVSSLIQNANVNSITLEIHTLRDMPSQLMTDVSGYAGVVSVESMDSKFIKVEFSGTTEEQSLVTEAVFRSGAGVLSMNERGADLESVYMQLTEEDGSVA